jgi:cyclic-di-GMP phosphodiesterase TipF (flagellum assembly factor)
MKNLTTTLLFGSYFGLAATASAVLWNQGADSGACIAALFAVLGLCIASHSLIVSSNRHQAMGLDIDRVKEAHRLMVEAIDQTQKDMNELADRVQNQRSSRAEELSSEVRMLEELVKKLGHSIEERIKDWKTAPKGPVVPLNSAKPDQALALIETIREALIENRVDLYLQPVVSLPQRKVLFYESFSRLRDVTGRIMMPAEYLRVAEPEGLVPSIDNLLLFRCVQIVRRLAKQDRKIGIFCNISLSSLRDETFFPQFLEFLSEHRDLSGSLIFELGQDHFNGRGAIEARNMAKLAEMGFRFSIDKVNSIDFDLQDLHRSDVRYVKIGAELLLSQLLELEGRPALKFLKDIHAGDFTSLLSRYGIEVIAEKIENEKQVVDILDISIGYGQGHLFGEPRAIKEAVLAEADPPAGFMRASMPTIRRRA